MCTVYAIGRYADTGYRVLILLLLFVCMMIRRYARGLFSNLPIIVRLHPNIQAASGILRRCGGTAVHTIPDMPYCQYVEYYTHSTTVAVAVQPVADTEYILHMHILLGVPGTNYQFIRRGSMFTAVAVILLVFIYFVLDTYTYKRFPSFICFSCVRYKTKYLVRKIRSGTLGAVSVQFPKRRCSDTAVRVRIICTIYQVQILLYICTRCRIMSYLLHDT